MNLRSLRPRHVAVLSLAVLSLAAAPVPEDTSTSEPQPEETSAEVEATEDGTTQDATADDTTEAADDDASEGGTDEPDASATAVEVEGVIVISQATASEDGAGATVVELGDERLVGGDADGGSSSGAILDTGDTELGRLAVGPWSAQTGADGSSSQTSVAEVTVIGPDTFYAHVLRSRAAADGGGGTSASSDAVVIGLAGEDEIRVLSSTWTADGPESALVRQGDQTIGEDTDGQCQFAVPSVLQLLCLTGTDGQGGTLVPGDNEDATYASVAETKLLDEQGAAVLRAGGEREPAADTDPDVEDTTAEGPAPGGDGDLAAAPDAPDEDGSLPRTGGGLTVLAAGLLLLAIGLVLRRRAVLTA